VTFLGVSYIGTYVSVTPPQRIEHNRGAKKPDMGGGSSSSSPSRSVSFGLDEAEKVTVIEGVKVVTRDIDGKVQLYYNVTLST